jgi:hypothetical protein
VEPNGRGDGQRRPLRRVIATASVVWDEGRTRPREGGICGGADGRGRLGVHSRWWPPDVVVVEGLEVAICAARR